MLKLSFNYDFKSCVLCSCFAKRCALRCTRRWKMNNCVGCSWFSFVLCIFFLDIFHVYLRKWECRLSGLFWVETDQTTMIAFASNETITSIATNLHDDSAMLITCIDWQLNCHQSDEPFRFHSLISYSTKFYFWTYTLKWILFHNICATHSTVS